MSIGRLFALYGITTVAFFAIDLVWLSTMTPRFYIPYLGSLMSDKPNMAVAGAFYVFYVVGLLALAVVPGLQEGAIVGALWRAALFGLLAYATYDLTNLATIAGWPWQIAVVDMVWGTTITTVVAAISYYAGTWLGLAAK